MSLRETLLFKLKAHSSLRKFILSLLCAFSLSANAAGGFDEIQVCGVMHGIGGDSSPKRMYAVISDGSSLNDALGSNELYGAEMYMLVTDIYGSFRLFELPLDFSWSDNRTLQLNDQNHVKWTVRKGWRNCY